MTMPPKNQFVIKLLRWLESIGLFIITIATMVAIGSEAWVMLSERRVDLHNILSIFIYLEILTMVGLYSQSGKLPVRYPIYIAMVAIARYMITQVENPHTEILIWLALAILILALAVLAIRYGHVKYPYNERPHDDP
jgi:protein PsiE